jgi:voltage-gated potassium channel
VASSKPSTHDQPEGRLATSYNVFMLALCVYALVIQAVEVFFHPDSASRQILNYADHVLCGFFFVDFVVSLIRAPRKGRYLLTWGWVDLLSSIPVIPSLAVSGEFRWGRIARMTRVFRVLRGVRATRILGAFLLRRRVESAFLSALLLAILLVFSSSILILHFESGSPAGIHTAADAIWWSVDTFTLMGNSPSTPFTHPGHVVGLLLTLAGIAIFAVFTGYVASWFLAPGEQEQTREMDEIQAELAALRKAVEEIRDRKP